MGIFIDAIKQGNVTYGNGDQIVETTWNLGNGNHNVQVTGSKTNVIAGDGNTKVTSRGSDCSISLGNGNQTVTSTGNRVNISMGSGTSTIASKGNNVNISTGNGDKTITSIGDNVNITTGDGDDDVTFIGDNVSLNTGDGDNSVLFWGNNVNIKMGNGNDKVTTFDTVYDRTQDADDPNLDDFSKAFIDKLPTGTWENWIFKSKACIDKEVKNRFLYTKIRKTYEIHYDVETYFSRYINGVKNTKIDMGGGNNTANVTMDRASSTIGGSGTNDITYNKKWQIDKLIDVRDEVRLERKTSRKGNALGILSVVFAGVAAVAAVAAPAVAGLGAIAGSVANAVTTYSTYAAVATGTTRLSQ